LSNASTAASGALSATCTPFCIALWLNWQAVRSLSAEPV
jgi:hypothetical protein